MHLTYIHFHADTGRVFYVGAGNQRRPYVVGCRTKAWDEAAADGYVCLVAGAHRTEDAALAHEAALIAHLAPFGGLVNVRGVAPAKNGMSHNKRLVNTIKV